MSEFNEDIHARIWGKKAEDVFYSEQVCPFCNSRIDEFGYCACGSGAD